MNRKITLLLLLLISMIILSGCGAWLEADEELLYRDKQIAAAAFVSPNDQSDWSEVKKQRVEAVMLGETVTRSALQQNPDDLRALAFAWGEGDIKYHWGLPSGDALVMTTFSATTMTAYNYSYIINAPAKYIANLRMNLTSDITFGTAVTYMILDTIVLLWGLFLASTMSALTIPVAFVFNPLQTFHDLIPVLIDTLFTTLYSMVNFFY